jgi:hypothetical protein
MGFDGTIAGDVAFGPLLHRADKKMSTVQAISFLLKQFC